MSKGGSKQKVTPKRRAGRKKAFLEAFAVCGQVTQAAQEAGVSRCYVYQWKKKDEQFAEDFAAAEKTAVDTLVDEAVRRARDGTFRYKFDKDGNALLDPITGEVYREYSYSDVLLIYLLKCHGPEKYGEKVTHQGSDGGPIRTESKIILEAPDNGRGLGPT